MNIAEITALQSSATISGRVSIWTSLQLTGPNQYYKTCELKFFSQGFVRFWSVNLNSDNLGLLRPFRLKYILFGNIFSVNVISGDYNNRCVCHVEFRHNILCWDIHSLTSQECWSAWTVLYLLLLSHSTQSYQSYGP